MSYTYPQQVIYRLTAFLICDLTFTDKELNERLLSRLNRYIGSMCSGIGNMVFALFKREIISLTVRVTVLPTDSTSRLSENKWGCELVIRSATTSYCALGMFDAIKDKANEIRDIFESACSSIQMWDNNFEMTHKTPELCACIDKFQKRFVKFQKPLLSGLDSLLSIFDENNRVNRQGINTIVIDLITRTISAKYILSEYYYGLFINDKQLKELINTKMFSFVRNLSELEVYNAYPSRNSEVIGIHLSALIEEYQKISDDFDSWMETKKFKMGKAFDFGDDFILEYEEKAQHINNKK